MSADRPSLTTEFLKRKIIELEKEQSFDEWQSNALTVEVDVVDDDSLVSNANTEAGASPQSRKMATEADLRKEAIGAAEARTDTKIARLEGKLDLVLSKLDDVKADGRHTRANIIVVGVSLALLIIGIVAAAPVVLDFGFKAREAITKEVQEQVHKSTPTTKQ